jgi:hypothetical protein
MFHDADYASPIHPLFRRCAPSAFTPTKMTKKLREGAILLEKEKLREGEEDQSTAAVEKQEENRKLRECEQRQRGDSIHGVATKTIRTIHNSNNSLRGAKRRTVRPRLGPDSANCGPVARPLPT